MKKTLSLMLVLALILTTLALPMTVSAADIDMLAETDTPVELYFAVDTAEPYNPGDEVTVDVMVKATDGEPLNADFFSVDVTYNTEYLTYVNAAAETGFSFGNVKDQGNVRILNEGNSTSITADGTKIATLTYKVVARSSEATTTLTFNTLDTEILTINGSNVDQYDITATQSNTINIVPNSSSVTVNTAPLAIGTTQTFYSAEALTLTVDGTNIESITIKEAADEEASPIESPYSVTAAGTYTVTVNMVGKSEAYTFVYVQSEVEAEITASVKDLKATGYLAGETFEVPVTLSGLTESGLDAAMVTFDVEYDPAVLELKSATNDFAIDGTSVKYGTEGAEEGIGDGEITVLTFEVVADAALGDTTVALANPQIALIKNFVDPTGTDVQYTSGDLTVTVVPEVYATLTGNDEYNAEKWANGEGYTYAVEATEDVAVKYIVVTGDSTITSVDKETFDAANELANGGVAVNAEATYYVVANVGSVYVIVDTLENGTDVWYDNTVPTATGSGSMDAWAKPGDTPVVNMSFEYNDALSGIAEYKYQLNGTDEWVDYEPGSTLTLPEVENTSYSSMLIKVIDKAGNESATATVDLKIDADAPTVSLEKADQSEGKVVVTVTAADAGGSGIASTLWYRSATQLSEPTVDTIEATGEGTAVTDGKFEAISTGYYYVVVKDVAGNTAWDVEYIDISHLNVASGIKVKTVNNDELAAKAGFKTVADYEALALSDGVGGTITTNGTYTYLYVVADAAPAGYANTFALTKDGENVDLTDIDFATGYAFDQDDIGAYVLTVTTTHTVDSSDKQSGVYNFSIVAPENMVSPNKDNRYNIVEYAMIKVLIGDEVEGVLPTSLNEFYGGLYSGDMNGDLTLTGADFAQILKSLQDGETPGAYYSLDIMNQTKPVE